MIIPWQLETKDCVHSDLAQARGLLAVIVLLAALFVIRPSCHAQMSQPANRLDQTALPIVPTRTIHFETQEATWSSVDVSPDGKKIVFDLLGDLYVLPMSGGVAHQITEGMAVDMEPRFSPDGSTIAFVSDRSGEFNVWTVRNDGSGLHQITRERHIRIGSDLAFFNPTWTPDGRALIVTSMRDYPYSFDLVAFDLHGEPLPGIHLMAKETLPDHFTSSASFGCGIDCLYAVQWIGTGDGNATNPSNAFRLIRINTRDGTYSTLVEELGGVLAVRAAPDGNSVAYAVTYPSSNGPKTGLKLFDIRTGRSRWILDEIEPALSARRPYWSMGIVPGFAFTPEGRNIVLSRGGKLWSVDIASTHVTEIRFMANVNQALGPLLRFPVHDIDSPKVRVRTIHDVRPSPDNKYLAFAALDRVWVEDLASGKTWMVDSSSRESQYSPAWSPDGGYLAYATWTDRGGHIKRLRRTDVDRQTGVPEQLDVQTDFYDRLVYSPDGSRLVAIHTSWRQVLETTANSTVALDLISIPVAGGAPEVFYRFEDRRLHAFGLYGYPQFSQRDATRVFFYHGQTLWALSLYGENPQKILSLKCGGWPPEGHDILLSPDGSKALVAAQSTISIVALPRAGVIPNLCFEQSLAVYEDVAQSIPLNPLTKFGGEFPWWSSDSGSFNYELGTTYFKYDLDLGTIHDQRAAPHAELPMPGYEPVEMPVTIKVDRDMSHGDILLRGARLLTMDEGKIIEKGDLLIHDNRIVALGKTGSIPVRQGTFEFDARGKTILPGYVLTHEHVDPLPQSQLRLVWQYLTLLAYGVTTINDPQAGATAVKLTYADRVEAGSLLGPRHITTGVALTHLSNTSTSYIEDLARRYALYYNTHMLKNRDAGSRHTEQLIAIAAAEDHLTPVAHWMDPMSRVLDGYSGIEHMTPFPWYGDIAKLIAKSGTVYTPTTITGGNGTDPMGYFRVRTDFTAETKLWTFSPSRLIAPITHPEWATHTHANIAPEQDYTFRSPYGEAAAKVIAAGGRVGISSDGFFLGLGAHWEMWALALSKVSPAKVLESATLTGAIALGLDNDLGSLTPGKIADLQILDRNPLEDIHNTNSVHWVVKGGRVYEGATLDQVWPLKKPLIDREDERPWWWSELPPWHPDAPDSSPGR